MLALLLAFLSGIPALMYQVVWTREVTLLAGGQLDAIATVVAAFFGGLALGARTLGGVADRSPRPLRLYALLECAAAVLALGTMWGLRALDASTSWSSAGMLAASAVLLLPPTIALGGTQPALLRSTGTRAAGATGPAGRIQGSNTLGAVAGVGLAVLGIPHFGLWTTLCLAALLATGIGATALLFDRARGPDPRIDRATRLAPPLPFALLLLAAGAGFATLGYEVLAARMATLRLGSSLYAWGLVLALFLAGLGAGNLAFARIAARTARPWQWLGGVEATCAGLIALGLPILHPPLARTAGGIESASLAAIALGTLPAAVLMGGAFPLFARLLLDTRPGRSFGALTAWNTAGGIAGSLLAPLLLIPLLGLTGAVLACSAVGFFIASAIFALAPGGSRPRTRVLVANGVFFLLAGSVGVAGVRIAQPNSALFAAHGRHASAMVVAHGAQRDLVVDGDPEASTASAARRTEELLAALPLAIHPRPRRFLEVGLGSGITLGTAARFPLEAIDCVEIASSVIDAAEYFEPDNRGVLRDPRVRLIRRDATVFLREADLQYDVITANTLHPWSVGATGLYSAEYFQRVARALSPGGIAAQWLPTQRLAPGHFLAIVRTFFEAFPAGGIFWGAGNVILLGSQEPIVTPDSQTLLDRLASTGLDPAPKSLASGGALDRRQIATAETVRARIGAEKILRNDRPVLERPLPETADSHAEALVLDELVALAASDPERIQNAGAIALWLEARAARRRGLVELAEGREELALRAGLAVVPELRAERLAMEGHTALHRNEISQAEGLYERALGSDPDSAEAELGLGSLALQRGNHAEAAQRLRRVVARRPNHPGGWQQLAATLHEFGRPREAAAAIDRALASNPFFPDALATAGLIAVQRGDRAEVERLLTRMSALHATPHRRALHDLASVRWPGFGD